MVLEFRMSAGNRCKRKILSQQDACFVCSYRQQASHRAWYPLFLRTIPKACPCNDELSSPAFCLHESSLQVVLQEKLDLRKLLCLLKKNYNCNQITIQTDGTLNACFLREKLFDYIDIIVAPVLIGGGHTTTFIDGYSLTSVEELSKLGILQLEQSKSWSDSYIRLKYKALGKDKIGMLCS